METTIDFIRHGEPEGGSYFRGNSIDDPLSEKGWAQMRAAVGDACPWTTIVSSPLQRCYAFAELFSQQHSLPLRVDERLKEVGFGDWEGSTRAQVKAKNMSQYQAFYSDPVNHCPPGAEPLEEFFARVSQAIEMIVANYSSQHVLVVAHAGVIRAAIAHALEASPTAAYRVQVVNAGLTRFRHDETGYYFDFLNRASVW